jgi:DNA-binding NtrC family response regulator
MTKHMGDANKIENILLIDDDEDDYLFLSQALAEVSSALRLRCIQNADHFFEAIEINKPSLIF